MTTKLLHGDVWGRVSALARKYPGKCHVAVAYFGTGASKLVPLQKGSLLVVDMSEKAVKSGQTNPSEVLKLIKLDVEVASVENLHAKVFVLDRYAIVGSTNASQHSAKSLIEAAIETTEEAAVTQARKFVLGLAGEDITQQHARALKALYKPPKLGKGSGRTPQHPPLWVVSLEETDWDAEDNAADKEGSPKAVGKLRSTRLFRVDRFCWQGQQYLDKFSEGDQLLQIIKVSNTRFVYPAGRVLHVERYKVGNSYRAIIYLEVRKRLKRKKLKDVVNRLPPVANLLKKIVYSRLLKNKALVHDLLNLWPSDAARKSHLVH